MNATMRLAIGAVATAALIGSVIGDPTAALADNQPTGPRDVTYLARIDGMVEGGQATFQASDTETQTAELASGGFGPGPIFEAHALLADLSRAGIQVVVPAPYSANVHCEIRVDSTPISRLDRFIAPDSGGGALTCGASPAGATGTS